MTKKIISLAIEDSLLSKKLFILTLKSYQFDKRLPREDRMTLEISNNLARHLRDFNLPQYFIRDNNNLIRYIDFVQFRVNSISFQPNEIEWGLEAKHYSPHQDIGNLNSYLQNSINGINEDIQKLINCGIQNKYILALQTQILDVHTNDLLTLIDNFPFIKYLGNTIASINSNINVVTNQNRIFELRNFLMQNVDTNLKYGFADHNIKMNDSEISVRINYFICKHE
jgi:hypothetical protein